MKNVLLTTTALVAFAGAAVAADVDLAWSGDAKVEYSFAAPTGISYGANAALDVTITQDLNNGAVASLSLPDFVSWNDVTGITAAPTWIAKLETSYGSISAGDIENVNFESYSEVAGMALGEANFGVTGVHDLRAETTLGGYAIAASTDTVGGDTAVQVSGAAGSLDFAVYYETAIMGATASTTLGGMDLSFGYADDGTETSVGVGVGYAVTSTISASASYASNAVAGAASAVGVAYDDGAFSASADYGIESGFLDLTAGYTGELQAGLTVTAEVTVADALGAATVGYSADVAYVSGDLGVYAGYDDLDGYYAGANYDLGSGAAAYVYTSEYVDAGPLEWGIASVIGLSISF